MNKTTIENLFNKYQQEGNKLQEALDAKRDLLNKTQAEIREIEYAITLKNGNIQALQDLYAEISKEEEAAKEEVQPSEKEAEVVEAPKTEAISEEK